MNTRDIQERIARIKKEYNENGGSGIVCFGVLIWPDRLMYEAYYGKSMKDYKNRPESALQWLEDQHAKFMKSNGKLTPGMHIEIVEP